MTFVGALQIGKHVFLWHKHLIDCICYLLVSTFFYVTFEINNENDNIHLITIYHKSICFRFYVSCDRRTLDRNVKYTPGDDECKSNSNDKTKWQCLTFKMHENNGICSIKCSCIKITWNIHVQMQTYWPLKPFFS